MNTPSPRRLGEDRQPGGAEQEVEGTAGSRAGPRMQPASMTAKVCRVIGTPAPDGDGSDVGGHGGQRGEGGDQRDVAAWAKAAREGTCGVLSAWVVESSTGVPSLRHLNGDPLNGVQVRVADVVVKRHPGPGGG